MACEQGPYYWALVMLLMVSYCYGALNEASNELLNATKVSMTTPPDGMCQWKLTDSKGRVCMLMEMKGIIFDGITTTSIPQAARATRRTSCDSEYNSVFELEWSDNNFITNSLCMHFRVRHGNYTITKLEVSRKVFESIHLVSIQRPRKSPTVSVGSSMQCKDLNFNMVGFEELRFQPFARLSNGTFGKDGRCYLIHRVHPGVYAGVAILILVVCMVAAYITFKIIQYYRRRHRQNYERL